jgi:hypothetical protein
MNLSLVGDETYQENTLIFKDLIRSLSRTKELVQPFPGNPAISLQDPWLSSLRSPGVWLFQGKICYQSLMKFVNEGK